MDIRRKKVGHAMGMVANVQLNAAEKIRVAERLIEDVQTSLAPLDDPAMCVAEGMLRASMHGIEDAREHVEAWPKDDLPVPL